MKNARRMILCIIFCVSFALLSGCSNGNGATQAKTVAGEIVHIVDLSKEEAIEQDGYIIYVYGYVGDLMTVWVNEDTEFVGDEDNSWQTVLSEGKTGIFFSGTVFPTDDIDDDRLPCVFAAKELTLQSRDQGGTTDE